MFDLLLRDRTEKKFLRMFSKNYFLFFLDKNGHSFSKIFFGSALNQTHPDVITNTPSSDLE